jgi:branched-chain amino acid transport system permease protein
VLLIVILLVRPGRHLRQSRGGEGLSEARRGRRVIARGAGRAQRAAAAGANPYHFQVLMLCGINIVLAVSLNLVNGFTGQFSIGHAGFMAVGAYASAMFTLKLGRPLVASLGRAGAGRQGVALLLALIGGRLRGAGRGLLVGPAVAAAARRLPRHRHARLRRDHPRADPQHRRRRRRARLPGIPALRELLLGLGSVVVVIVLSRHLAHSTHGRALFAIRDDESRGRGAGVDTTRYKVLAFVLGAFFAGVAGGLFAHYLLYLNPTRSRS